MTRPKQKERRQLGQSLTECLLVLTGVALVAMLGFGVMSSGIGTSSASVAEALAGGAPQPQAEFAAVLENDAPALADFDRLEYPEQDAGDAAEGDGSLAFAQGFTSGLIDTLWEELSALLSPIDTAVALAELGRLLATEFAETVELLFDELVAKQFDKLVNGNDYERGFVLGNQVSPFKALSVLAKASGASALAGIAKRAEEAGDGIARINGRRPINYRYAGKTHPSGVKFNDRGFPDFSPYAEAEVRLPGLTADYRTDEKLANAAVGLDRTPDGYVWHHVEDGKTMQLIPTKIHNAVRHTGGAAVIRANQGGGGK